MWRQSRWRQAPRSWSTVDIDDLPRSSASHGQLSSSATWSAPILSTNHRPTCRPAADVGEATSNQHLPKSTLNENIYENYDCNKLSCCRYITIFWCSIRRKLKSIIHCLETMVRTMFRVRQKLCLSQFTSSVPLTCFGRSHSISVNLECSIKLNWRRHVFCQLIIIHSHTVSQRVEFCHTNKTLHGVNDYHKNVCTEKHRLPRAHLHTHWSYSSTRWCLSGSKECIWQLFRLR